jgi:hypothetical protein
MRETVRPPGRTVADMADHGSSPVHLTPTGPPETVLAPEPAEVRHALAEALGAPDGNRRSEVSDVVARYPRSLAGWASLGELARDEIEAYACFRVGYHRGLDALRASGWRGSGYVRWEHETNQGFLRALQGLQRMAAAIGEVDEADRCATFLAQLDPSLR